MQQLTMERRPLRSLDEIEHTIRASAMMELQGALTAGVCLMEAKEQLGHGQWLPWLKKMGISSTFAERRMRLAREIPEGSPLAALNYHQAMAVLALPADERETFVAENDAKDKTAAEIKQLIKEKTLLEHRVKMAEDQRDAALRDACHLSDQVTELRNRPALVQQVIETPDDYQELKLSAVRHKAEIEEMMQAVQEAEARAVAAEADLRKVRREGVSAPEDRYAAAMGAVNTFLMAVQLLPYDKAELGSLYNRQRYTALVKPIREWCDEMADALAGGALDAEGAVE